MGGSDPWRGKIAPKSSIPGLAARDATAALPQNCLTTAQMIWPEDYVVNVTQVMLYQPKCPYHDEYLGYRSMITDKVLTILGVCLGINCYNHLIFNHIHAGRRASGGLVRKPALPRVSISNNPTDPNFMMALDIPYRC